MTRTFFTLAAVASITALAPSLIRGAEAGTVVLSPKTGGFDFEGDLKSYDGSSYELETPTGSMKFPANAFDCRSGDCPEGTRRAPDQKAAVLGVGAPSHFTISGDPSIGDNLIPGLVRAFGLSRGEKGIEEFRAYASETHFHLYKPPAVPAVEVDIFRYGTEQGLTALARGEADIAMAAHAVTPQEIEAAQFSKEAAATLEATVVALDAVAVLVSPKRDVAGLTLSQLGRIFSGQIADWSELRLAPGRIKLYTPENGVGALNIFNAKVMKPLNLVVSPLAVRMDDFESMSDLVAADPDAIAIVSMAFRREAKSVPITDGCGIATPLTPFTVKTEEYQLSHRSYLYTVGQVPGIVAQFIRFTQGFEAQTTVADKQFVNQSILIGAPAAQTPRIVSQPLAKQAGQEQTVQRRLTSELGVARRLSTTFRFAVGTSQLDDRAREDVIRLGDWLRLPQNANMNVVLAGFSDQTGSFGSNVQLSERRAAQVRTAILAVASDLAPARIEARGFGPLAPVACNADAVGPEMNRRVEVWLKN